MKSRVSSASYKKALQSISSMTRKVVEGQNSKMDKATVEAVYHAMNTADLADAAFADLIAVMDHFCENPVIVFKCLKLIYILLELDHLRFFEIAQNFLPDIETIRVLNFGKVKVANRTEIHCLAKDLFLHLTRDAPLPMPDTLELEHIVVNRIIPRTPPPCPVVADEDMIEWLDPVKSNDEPGETIPDMASGMFDPFAKLQTQDLFSQGDDLLIQDSPLLPGGASPLVETGHDLDVLWMPDDRQPTSPECLTLIDMPELEPISPEPDNGFEPIVDRHIDLAQFEPIGGEHGDGFEPIQREQSSGFEPIQTGGFEPIEYGQVEGFEPIERNEFHLLEQIPEPKFERVLPPGHTLRATGSDMFEPLPKDEFEPHSDHGEPRLNLEVHPKGSSIAASSGRFNIQRHSLAPSRMRTLLDDDEPH